MSNSALVIGVLVVAIFVVIAALIVKSQRSQRLKSRFGPEYNLHPRDWITEGVALLNTTAKID